MTINPLLNKRAFFSIQVSCGAQNLCKVSLLNLLFGEVFVGHWDFCGWKILGNSRTWSVKITLVYSLLLLLSACNDSRHFSAESTPKSVRLIVLGIWGEIILNCAIFLWRHVVSFLIIIVDHIWCDDAVRRGQILFLVNWICRVWSRNVLSLNHIWISNCALFSS